MLKTDKARVNRIQKCDIQRKEWRTFANEVSDSNPNPGTYHLLAYCPRLWVKILQSCVDALSNMRMNGCKNTQELADALCKDKTLSKAFSRLEKPLQLH